MADESAAGGVGSRSDMDTTFPVWDDTKVEEILTAEDGTSRTWIGARYRICASDRVRCAFRMFFTPR